MAGTAGRNDWSKAVLVRHGDWFSKIRVNDAPAPLNSFPPPFEKSHAGADQFFRIITAAGSQRFEFFATNSVVGRKKENNLVYAALIQREGDEFRRRFFVHCSTNEFVVPHRLAFLGLFRLNHSEEADPRPTSQRHWLVVEDDDVERVAVLPAGGRNEPVIEWEHHSFRQGALEAEQAGLRGPGVLHPTAFGRFDNCINETAIVIKGVQTFNGVFHAIPFSERHAIEPNGSHANSIRRGAICQQPRRVAR